MYKTEEIQYKAINRQPFLLNTRTLGFEGVSVDNMMTSKNFKPTVQHPHANILRNYNMKFFLQKQQNINKIIENNKRIKEKRNSEQVNTNISKNNKSFQKSEAEEQQNVTSLIQDLEKEFEHGTTKNVKFKKELFKTIKLLFSKEKQHQQEMLAVREDHSPNSSFKNQSPSIYYDHSAANRQSISPYNCSSQISNIQKSQNSRTENYKNNSKQNNALSQKQRYFQISRIYSQKDRLSNNNSQRNENDNSLQPSNYQQISIQNQNENLIPGNQQYQNYELQMNDSQPSLSAHNHGYYNDNYNLPPVLNNNSISHNLSQNQYDNKNDFGNLECQGQNIKPKYMKLKKTVLNVVSLNKFKKNQINNFIGRNKNNTNNCRSHLQLNEFGDCNQDLLTDLDLPNDRSNSKSFKIQRPYFQNIGQSDSAGRKTVYKKRNETQNNSKRSSNNNKDLQSPLNNNSWQYYQDYIDNSDQQNQNISLTKNSYRSQQCQQQQQM